MPLTTETDLQQQFEAMNRIFTNDIQKFQYLDKYSRWLPDKKRRETWIESVTRVVDFLQELAPEYVTQDRYDRIYDAILKLKVMPAMRLLATAGETARRNNFAAFNCSFQGVDSIDSFVEALQISMNGCGVGYSVEARYISQLPVVRVARNEPFAKQVATYYIEDTTEGWAAALRHGLETWFDGRDVRFDYSQIRPAGAPLVTKGGYASGPDPLRYLLDFTKQKVRAAAGRQLTSLEVSDIMNVVGQAAVSGGHRRSSEIALFDADDTEMLLAKQGDFDRDNSQRWNANFSAIWPETGITREAWDAQWDAMVAGNRGEPGIFNRQAIQNTLPDRRERFQTYDRFDRYEPIPFGTNPCAEIILRDKQVCNLTSVVCRPDDTLETLREKVEIATIIGTIQSKMDYFPGFRPQWAANQRAERLLGVDLNGQRDCRLLEDGFVLQRLRKVAQEVNTRTALMLGINRAAAITCVKPSGNSGTLLDTASGLHPRWAKFYIRNVRVGAHTSLGKLLYYSGVPINPENGQDWETCDTYVVSFPMKAPEGSLTRNDLSALDQMDYWKHVKLNYTEHNPSVTITYKPDEVEIVREWVWDNRDIVSGMAFLPRDDSSYPQLPYIEIDEAEYNRRVANWPNIDWAQVVAYDAGNDETNATFELACAGGSCELV